MKGGNKKKGDRIGRGKKTKAKCWSVLQLSLFGFSHTPAIWDPGLSPKTRSHDHTIEKAMQSENKCTVLKKQRQRSMTTIMINSIDVVQLALVCLVVVADAESRETKSL